MKAHTRQLATAAVLALSRTMLRQCANGPFTTLNAATYAFFFNQRGLHARPWLARVRNYPYPHTALKSHPFLFSS